MKQQSLSKGCKIVALHALRGKWGSAVLVGFVASLLGGSVISGSGISFNFSGSGSLSQPEQDAIFGSDIWQQLLPIIITVVIITLIYTLALAVISGVVRMGYASYNLNLVDQKPAGLDDLFMHMNRMWKGFCMNFFMSLYVSLWSLLLVIPGIIKRYAYAMTPYIMAEHPEMTANEAITESDFLMKGHKWELFCLHFSFIGWVLLANLPALSLLVIGIIALDSGASPVIFIIALLLCLALLFVSYLFLNPYMEAAQAAFYRNISYKAPTPETERKEVIPEIEA